MILFLHIGYGKTATTSIQHFLRRNAAQLRQEGVFWAEQVWQERNAASGKVMPTRIGTVGLPWYISERIYANLKNRAKLPDIGQLYKYYIETIKVDIDGFFRQLEQQRAYCDKMILSSEDFSCFPYALFFPCDIPRFMFVELRERFILRIRECLSGFDDVRIVVGLRRQDRYLESAYNQVVSSWLCYGNTIKNFQKFHANALDYADNLNAWAARFGRENILVMPFEKRAMPRGPIQYFLDIIGYNADPARIKNVDIHANYSAAQEVLADKLYYNRFLKDFLNDFEQEQIQDYFDAKIDAEMRSNVLLLTALERAAILDRYAESNRTVARLFLNDLSGNLFKDDMGESAEQRLDFLHKKTLPKRPSLRLRNLLRHRMCRLLERDKAA